MSLYSDLNEVLIPYAQKIKEKADKSTTYTKTEVDHMIEDVEVETDTTLEVAGAAADAAETGRQIGLLKADLGDAEGRLTQLDETIYKEIVDEKIGTYSATAGSSILSQTHLVDVSIANGTTYKFVLHANGIVNKYHLYANGAAVRYNLIPGTEYNLTAASDITWISIFVSASDVTGSGTVTGVVTQTETNSGSIEEKLETAEMSISELKNLVKADVIYFYPVYEVGANINNDSGNTTYIYHQFTVPADYTQKVGILVDSIEGATAIHPVVAVTKNSSGTTIQRFEITAEQAKNGFSFMPESNSTVLLLLYPSTTGGLTTETAKYKNVCIFTSNDGTYTIKKQSVPNLYQIPSYYEKESYIANKIETIEGLMASANGNYDAFIFCTDQHWTLNAKQSPNLVNYIYQWLNIPRMFMGGDFADGINLNALKAYRDAFPGKIYNVIGNHEYMNYLALTGESYKSHNITPGDIYAYINMHMTDAVGGDFSRGYYYVDNVMQKMRYIILSVYADNGNGASAQFESAQKTWLQNEALNLPNGYTAVIFAHFLYSIDYDTGVATKASTTDEILSVVDAYSGNGEIACMIAGHTHVDGMTTTPGGIPVFVTTCDKCKPWISNGTDMEPWITENRIEGTITEQAFDVVIINKTSKLISFVRIGAPADNGAEAKLEIRQQNYGT